MFDKAKYLEQFYKVKANRRKGISPVYNEMRVAKTQIIECLPYTCIQGTMLILATLFLNKLHLNEVVSIAIVLIVKGVADTITNFIYTVIKHRVRKRFCNYLGIEFTEENIAVLESLEYQTI